MPLPVGLEELAALGGPERRTVVIRNTLPTIATFVDDTGASRIAMKWEAAGDPHGGDVREVPQELLANPQFREMVYRGIYAIDTDPQILRRALEAQRSHWDSRQLSAASAEVELMRSQDQVVATGQPCIAPRGRELCGAYGIVDEKTKDQPPLCPEHRHLAPQYKPNETGRVIDGKPEVVWRRAAAARV
jgi:hypothetical protein